MSNWDRFYASGKVSDYLAYCRYKSHLEGEGKIADNNRRSCSERAYSGRNG